VLRRQHQADVVVIVMAMSVVMVMMSMIMVAMAVVVMMVVGMSHVAAIGPYLAVLRIKRNFQSPF
jgi:hypothetical protein